MIDEARGKAIADAIVAKLGFGNTLAAIVSWHSHQSIMWAIIHGVLGWPYVIYWRLTN